jgi:glycosyltransferase involved in cell wall biosynthesis
MGLSSTVTFLGHVQDIESFYRSCDVVVLTSKSRSIEGSPNAMLEAMAMECPVVATEVGGVAEAVRHGVEGFLVPPDDAARFADCLVALLSDGALRRRMGAAGRAAVLERFDHQVVVSRLAGILRDVVLTARVRRGDHRGSGQPPDIAGRSSSTSPSAGTASRSVDTLPSRTTA